MTEGPTVRNADALHGAVPPSVSVMSHPCKALLRSIPDGNCDQRPQWVMFYSHVLVSPMLVLLRRLLNFWYPPDRPISRGRLHLSSEHIWVFKKVTFLFSSVLSSTVWLHCPQRMTDYFDVHLCIRRSWNSDTNAMSLGRTMSPLHWSLSDLRQRYSKSAISDPTSRSTHVYSLGPPCFKELIHVYETTNRRCCAPSAAWNVIPIWKSCIVAIGLSLGCNDTVCGGPFQGSSKVNVKIISTHGNRAKRRR